MFLIPVPIGVRDSPCLDEFLRSESRGYGLSMGAAREPPVADGEGPVQTRERIESVGGAVDGATDDDQTDEGGTADRAESSHAIRFSTTA